MTRRFGSLGGRDDISLAADLPDLGKWTPTGTHYEEADEVSDPGEFPQHGFYLEVELLPPGETGQHYVQVTEGLEGLLMEKMDAEGASLQSLTVEIDTAEKAGEEETAPWRYTGQVTVQGDDEAESGP